MLYRVFLLYQASKDTEAGRFHVDKPQAGRAPLEHTVSAPCGHVPFQAHPHHWLACGVLFPEIPGLYKAGVITQKAAECQSFIPAPRGLQTSQLDSKRKANPEHGSTEGVCWTHSLFSSPGLSWTLDMRNSSLMALSKQPTGSSSRDNLAVTGSNTWGEMHEGKQVASFWFRLMGSVGT